MVQEAASAWRSVVLAVARSIKMPFVPSTLKKVREISGCSVEDAAKRVRKEVDTVRRWESDVHEELPTLAQAKNLAKLYRYSAGVFLLEALPDFIRVPQIHDFRTLSDRKGDEGQSWSRNLRYLIRQMESRQEFVIDAIRRAETSYQPWVNSVRSDETSPEELAAKIRELLEVERDNPRDVSGIENVLKEWIKRYEELAGVFVFQTDNTKMPIEIEEMRGLSMADRHAPFIVLNSKDSQAGRIFTLFHEFSHLWLGASGISASDGVNFRGTASSDQRIERYCDNVAANSLMPEQEFLDSWNEIPVLDAVDRVEFSARKFSVSRHTVVVHAFNLGMIRWDVFSQMHERLAGPVEKSGSAASRDGGNYYATLRRNAGEKYVGLVLSEYYSDEITIKEAANLLDARIPSVFALADYVGFKP